MRLLAGALIVSLAIVPAVVRATRVFDPSGRPSIALSFKKSFEASPHAADIPPDLAVEPVVLAACEVVAAATAAVPAVPVRAADPLRGPPASVRS